MTKAKNTDHSKFWQAHGGTGILIHLWQCEMLQPLRNNLVASEKLMYLSMQPINFTRVFIYQTEQKAFVHTKTCTKIFLYLFVTAEN